MEEERQLTLIANVTSILEVEAPFNDIFNIRKISIEDKLNLAKLYLSSYSRDIVADMDDATSEIDQTFSGDYGVLDFDASFVVTKGTQLIGAILTVLEAPWEDTPKGPFLIDLFLHPEFRGKKLGHILISKAAKALNKNNKQTFALRVLSNNHRALNLYEKLGFKNLQ